MGASHRVGGALDLLKEGWKVQEISARKPGRHMLQLQEQLE